MFGKGSALGAWIKEFCELVFIQTLQAFIYALAIGLIMKMNVSAMENSDAASVLGFMCVICLTAIFKVEDILRKILGFGGTKADHGSAIKSIAKTAFAMQIGKRVLDNGKKMVGGTKNIIEGSLDKGKAKNKFDRRVKAYKMDNGMLDESDDSSALPLNESPKSNTVLESARNNERERLLSEAKNFRRQAILETDSKKSKELIDKAKQYEDRANSLGLGAMNTPVSGDAGASTVAGIKTPLPEAATPGADNSAKKTARGKDYYQKMQAFEDQYKDDVKAANKKRREGLRTLARGIAESSGALVGGTAGAILGFADGNLDEGFQGLVSGAGLGDAVGSGVVTAATAPADFAEWTSSAISDAVKNHSEAVKRSQEEDEKNARAQIEDMNKEAKSAITKIDKNAERRRDALQKEVEDSARETGRDIERHTRKSTSKRSTPKRATSSGNSKGVRIVSDVYDGIGRQVTARERTFKTDTSVESID